MAATIGPIDVMRAKERIEVHALATCGTFSSWHCITNTGAEELITLFWASEIFDPNHPDTYYEEVYKNE